MYVANGATPVLTRYYIGGQYELDAQTNVERFYLGGDVYSAPAVYVKEGGNWKIYYICRDYLGSITHVANADGSLKQELSYDAWGRLRNPATQEAYAPGSEPVLFLGRGYTGHEHLTWFGLINMNARLYDAALGRFLSPDPYVQMPDFSQNFNRYSYALNNPLRYSDESGEFFIVDDWIIGFVRGTIKGGLKEGWNTANKQAGNAAMIWGGLFTTDKSKGFFANLWEISSRFTWQLPQSLAGFTYSLTSNTLGQVDKVAYYGGATAVTHNEGSFMISGRNAGITLGSYINGGSSLAANPDNSLFQHEYGHYLQSQSMGLAYLPAVGIPSLYSTQGKNKHYYNPIEQDANARAIQYFYKRTDGEVDWHFSRNPIGLRENNWSMTDYNTEEFQNALKLIRSRVNVRIKDYISWVSMPFVALTGIENGSFYDGQRPYRRNSGRFAGGCYRCSIK